MPRDRGQPAAVRVYTVCDESRYLIVRNVPSLGCGAELADLFGTYGPVEECKPMDAEDCEPYTDVFFIKFAEVSNARFAKRKLDEFVFLGNRLQVFYAPQFESILDTKEKLEVRKKEVLGRVKCVVLIFHLPMLLSICCYYFDSIEPILLDDYQHCYFVFLGTWIVLTRYSRTFAAAFGGRLEGLFQFSPVQGVSSRNSHHQISSNKREYMKIIHDCHIEDPRFSHVPSNKDYFSSESMNATVKIVREKLDKIQSSGDHSSVAAASKKPRVDNRRRI